MNRAVLREVDLHPATPDVARLEGFDIRIAAEPISFLLRRTASTLC